MPLVASTIRDAVIAALNAKTYVDPDTGQTRPMFNVQPNTAPYAFINSAAIRFVALWLTMSTDMQPGTGPPPPGAYLHSHTMLGAQAAAFAATFETQMKVDLVGSGFYFVGFGGWERFLNCWTSAFLTHVDSAESKTTEIDGAILHTHPWDLLPDPTVIAADIIVCLQPEVQPPPGGYPFFVLEHVTELADAFITAIRNDSVLAPIVGAGHVHLLT